MSRLIFNREDNEKMISLPGKQMVNTEHKNGLGTGCPNNLKVIC